MAQELQVHNNGQMIGNETLAQDISSLSPPVSITQGLALPVGVASVHSSTAPSVAATDSGNAPSLLGNLAAPGSVPGLLPAVPSTSSVPGVSVLGDAQLGLPSIPPTSSVQLGALPQPAIGSLCRGTLFHVADGGTYGFIKPDGGGADVFAMPPLSGLPLAGSRVVCNLVLDQNLPGKLRAENVQLESTLAPVGQQGGIQPNINTINPFGCLGAGGLGSIANPGLSQQPQPQIMASHLPIDPMLATAAPAVNAQSLLASVTAAAETRALAAASDPSGVIAGLTSLLAVTDPTVQAVLTQQLLAGAALQGLQGFHATGAAAAVDTNGRQGGAMRHIQTDGKFGFIKPDNGGADILALPPQGGFPEIGARVTFEVIMDDKTGRPKADNLEVVTLNDIGAAAQLAVGGFGPLLAASGAALRSTPFPTVASQRPQGPVTQPGDNVLHGTISKVNAKFAFVKQDSGEADMFVIPPACEAFGRELPPVGTRVQYKVILDSKSGRPRADCVGPSLAPHLGGL
mmetsp:Transcript_58771/g.92926  ORF Transcript_58771/g.92926 Transcript_58771/m.92926 type:complete len:515 (+) Transcript_58771:126-1670(+)